MDYTKTILGLDLGTNSIGWALVKENQEDPSQSEIIKLGVRVNPLTVDEKTNFENGRPLSTNADRTLKRGARRNLQRFKLRREALINILINSEVISKDTVFTEMGKNSTHQTLAIRAKSAREKIDLEDFARVLMMINKKRGYKSSRKANNEEEGQAIDGMAVAKYLYEESLTPGQYVLDLLQQDKKYIPDFYRSDLQSEFDQIWEEQKKHYPNVLTDELKTELKDKNKSQTWAILKTPFDLTGIKLEGKANEQKLKRYELRAAGIQNKLEPEYLAIALQEINNDLNKSSGYLGAISDRSKELYFNQETVGENLYKQIQQNPHTSLKNQVFYRQDYLDEFEQIWETQAQYHKKLSPELKIEIRDIIIFYQRRLKSQKGLISFCQFESYETEYQDKSTGKVKKRTTGRRVIPKSSPLFQEFKIWQVLNNLELKNIESGERIKILEADPEVRQDLFEELNLRGDLKPNDILSILNKHYDIGKKSNWESNFKKIEGNRTNAALYNIYQTISEDQGYGHDWAKQTASQINEEIKATFPLIGINPNILEFDALAENFDKQDSYQLWHLLYSAEDDKDVDEEDVLMYGNNDVNLKKKLHQKYGFEPKYAQLLANLTLQPDYGSLSARAIRKILPYLIEGNTYDQACALAKYNHSNSMTAEERDTRDLEDKLEILKKNSLRNPVVEKILNQMVNVVNQIIDEYGKPDEVRIELARELKKTADQRAEMTKGINEATRRNEDIKKLLKAEFGIPNATRNDIIRYRLWKELESRGYKELFKNQQIPKEKLFSSEIDIEHIIPKALLFDDSFSNKTLTYRETNLEKGNQTAFDYIDKMHHADMEQYHARVEELGKSGKISKSKMNKLLMPQSKLPDDFIERDLRNSQYIARQSYQMLHKVIRKVSSTSGSITDKLREDWDLINVMKELNMPKYRALGLTETIERWDIGQQKLKTVEVIQDWSKRNDHRHHAMDALTVAFTTNSHVQYLNNLNASSKKDSRFSNLKEKITKVYDQGNGKKKRKFIPPMENFRTVAKEHIEDILVSIKAKNKVVTKNINKTKKKGPKQFHKEIQLTPRGQLHKETVYGKMKRPKSKATKINKKLSLEEVHLIIDKNQKLAILQHLEKYEKNPILAFDTKTLKKDPITVDEKELKEVLCFEEIYTIRKAVDPSLKIDKVIDEKIKRILNERLEKYDNDPKSAFSDLEENPIWFNEEAGIAIKRVTITGVSNTEALHHQHDHLGNEILDEEGSPIASDFVSTGNNHHVAIYEDEEGNLQEQVVSFYEAVIRANQKIPIIDKSYNQEIGWKFLFTMKQNEMFVFPSEDFDPIQIDLLDPKNARIISPHLFRVQKIATKNYMFRHHLESTINIDLEFTFHNLRSPNRLKGLTKLRLNHLGKIVHVGEY